VGWHGFSRHQAVLCSLKGMRDYAKNHDLYRIPLEIVSANTCILIIRVNQSEYAHWHDWLRIGEFSAAAKFRHGVLRVDLAMVKLQFELDTPSLFIQIST